MKVIICTPSHREINRYTIGCVKATGDTSKHDCVWVKQFDDALVSRARNNLLAVAMQQDADYIYWWDGDITTPHMQQGDNLIDMLVDFQISHAHGAIVGGLYATRGIGGHCASRPIEGEKADGVGWRVRYLAGGSMLVPWGTVKRMQKTYAELEYEPRINEGATVKTWALFQPFIHDGEYLSEDWAFCQRAAAMGIECWAHLDVELHHWGLAPFAMDKMQIL